MHFIDRLYTGENAAKNRGEILRDLQEKRYRAGVFVITPPSNGNNILDIYPAKTLKAPYYEKKDLLVIGIAKGRQEALLLAGTIVSQMYEETGGFCLQEFLKY